MTYSGRSQLVLPEEVDSVDKYESCNRLFLGDITLFAAIFPDS